MGWRELHTLMRGMVEGWTTGNVKAKPQEGMLKVLLDKSDELDAIGWEIERRREMEGVLLLR